MPKVTRQAGYRKQRIYNKIIGGLTQSCYCVCDTGLLVNKLQFPIMVIISNKTGCGSYMVGKF